MRLPAAAVLRYVLACPGRTDAKIQIRLQRKTSCRLETGMDDCVAAVTASGSILTPQPKNKKCQSVGTRSTWKMQSWLENPSLAFAMCIVQHYLLRSRYRLYIVYGVRDCLYSRLCSRSPSVWMQYVDPPPGTLRTPNFVPYTTTGSCFA